MDVPDLTKLNFGNLPPINISTNAPPIPTELIQPAVTPSVTIQPATGTKTVTIVPTKSLTPKTEDLNSLLIKRESETQDFFNMRSAYAKVALSVFQGKINPATAILLGQMAANKAVYGLTYPEESDRVIRYINEQIMINY